MDNRPVTAKPNQKRHLEIGGCDLVDLAGKFGTPLWVLDQATINFFCEQYTSGFNKHYPLVKPLYASKALCTIATTQIIKSKGFGFDVVSGGELYTVLKAGVDPGEIYMHGNNKSIDELELAITSKIGNVVVDNAFELETVNKISARNSLSTRIMFRITPEVDAHTHEFIQTGQSDSKFGIRMEDIVEVINHAKTMNNIKITGIHAHIGSQIFDVAPFKIATEKLCQLALDIRIKCGITLDELNVGGGLGIKYLPEDDPQNIEDFARIIGTTITSFCAKENYPIPTLIIEPGRSIVANAGVTLYTIGGIKNIPGQKTYLTLDGGMADNPRPILYGAQYAAEVAGKAGQKKTRTYSIAGKFCESGDILIKNILLPETEIGDILCVFTTGAYNYSMSSNYNRFLKPAMIVVNEGRYYEIIQRETYEDIIRNDLKLDVV